MGWGGGITCNPGGFTSEAGVIVGGKRDTNDSLSYSHGALQGLPVGVVHAPYHNVMQLDRMLLTVPL